MRYRTFPVARHPRPAQAKKPPSGALRSALTLFGAALVLGGLVRLATDDTTAVVASAGLNQGPIRAASSESEPSDRPTEEEADKASPKHDTASHTVDALNAAIVAMLSHER